ncbi:MAG: type II toxin-antitoxin system PemK/MazF family toxin [Planctomycetaceae bacterium]
MKRGDVVLVPFPFQDKLGEKIRPAVVVQSDADTARLINTVVVMITGNLDDAGQATTLVVDPSTPAGAGSGLAGASLIKTYNLATVRQKRIIATLGHLSDVLKDKLDACLKAALDLS